MPDIGRGVMCAVLACGVGAGAVEAADPVHGKVIFEACAACHTLYDDEAGDALGPTLDGVLGRTAGTRDDFRYSPVMRRSGIVWTLETLNAFITDPTRYVRGSRMSFDGVPDEGDRADVMAYLAEVLTVDP